MSSLEVKDGECDAAEVGDGGGRSGSTANAPGPGDEMDRRRKFLSLSAVARPHIGDTDAYLRVCSSLSISCSETPADMLAVDKTSEAEFQSKSPLSGSVDARSSPCRTCLVVCRYDR